FYVVDRLRDLMVGAPEGERLVLLLETAVAAGLRVALLRPARLARHPPGVSIPSGVPILLRGAPGLLIVSVLANVLGFVDLARLVGEGVLASGYAAVLLYGVLRIARALLQVGLRSHAAQRIHMVRHHRALLARRAERGLAILFVLLWAGFTLDLFTLRRPLLDAGRSLLEASIAFGTVEVSLGDLVAFGVTVVAAVWIARSLTFLLEEDVFPRISLRRGVPGAISATARYAILFGGFMLAVAAAGVDFERFTILAGALGVGIGFGLQNVVNNFVSGLILLYERPIQVGDAIQLPDLFGEVRRIGIRSSTVRTWDGAEVIVPNADLISSRVTNWTLSDRQRRMQVKVGVAYGSDPAEVLEILRRVAREHPDLIQDPPPFARFVGFGESSLDFELWAVTPRFERFWPTVNDVLLAIHEALREAGITIPFPQRDLHLRSADPEAAARLRGEEPKGGARPPADAGKPAPAREEPVAAAPPAATAPGKEGSA
ncbi:MAG: mechanosensitive ion channel, partial [Myxococcota bacterium]|nr:mechanosensitive ion channel [Myxococcota bacterium]